MRAHFKSRLAVVLALVVVPAAVLAGGVHAYDVPNSSYLPLPVTVANGGTGLATLTDEAVMIGNGTGVVQFVAPSTSGNVLTSNGTAWVSSAAAVGRSLLPYPGRYYAPTSGADATLFAVGFPAATVALNGGSTTAGFAGGTPASLYTSVTAADAEVSVISSAVVVRRPASTSPIVVSANASFETPAATERAWAVAATTINLSDTNADATASYCGIRYSTSVPDTNWMCCSADGAAASCDTLGARAAATVGRRFEIQMTTSACICRQIDGNDGAVLNTVTKTTNLPSTSTNLLLFHSLSPLNGGVAVRSRLLYLGLDIGQ